MPTRFTNSLATVILWLSGFFVIALLALLLGYIFWKGLPILKLGFLFGVSSDIRAGGGIASQLFNTVYILGLSLMVSIPLAIGAGIYLAEYAKDTKLTRLIRLSTESLATVPSIVLGLFGMILFVNFLGLGFSIIGGALALVLLNLPVLVRVTEESFRNVPSYYREASLALGATRFQTIWKILLPVAWPGIVTGITLVAGRAIGETAILIFTAGTTVSRFIPDFDLLAGGETLAVHLWYVMSVGLVPDRVEIANGIGALLIILVFFFNLLLAIPTAIWKRRFEGR